LKVLFLYPDIWAYGGGFHYGIAYISAILKENAHQVHLLHITKELSKKELTQKVRESKPDIVCFSSTTNQHSYVELYASWIKEAFDLPIVCGGIHATMCPDEVLSCKSLDIICVGEGEYPILDLVTAIEEGKDWSNIYNLWIKKDGEYRRNPIRPLIPDLDKLPFPDREVFAYQKLLRRRGGEADILAGRGCPYNCAYCSNQALREIYLAKGGYVRKRSVRNVLDEIKTVTNRYGGLVRRINIDDDTFTAYHRWVREFCDSYKKEFDYPFYCNVRADTVNREVLTLLKRAGCDAVRFGIESGNEWLQENVLNRRMTKEQIINATKTAHEVGLKVYTYNIIGLPFETPSMIEETIELNRLISPTGI